MNTLHKINLNRGDNPEFFAIVDDHNSIMDEWNRINNLLIGLSIPRYPSRRFKTKLHILAMDVLALQKRFLSWNVRASGLITKPNYIFAKDEEQIVGFMHYSGLLQNLRDQLDNHMILLASNNNRVHDTYGNQVSFSIAVASFVLTFLGLLASVVSIWYTR